jgi:hypothetical protein
MSSDDGFVWGCERDQGMALIEGDTQDLAQVAKAAQAWHDGTDSSSIDEVQPARRRREHASHCMA